MIGFEEYMFGLLGKRWTESGGEREEFLVLRWRSVLTVKFIKMTIRFNQICNLFGEKVRKNITGSYFPSSA